MAVTNANLSPAGEYCMTAMGLTDPERVQLRSCISNYAGQSGCVGFLYWIVYRIFNAVKSFFCCSDWQLAEKIVLDRAVTIARDLIPPVTRTSLERRVKEGMMRHLQIYTEYNLKNCYEVHLKGLEADAEFIQALSAISLETTLGQLRSVRERVLQELARRREDPIYPMPVPLSMGG